MVRKSVTVIPTDHSGPSFSFQGEVSSPEFQKQFRDWVDRETKSDARIANISADRDGGARVEFDFGEGSLSVTSTPGGTMTVCSSGDGEVTPVPGGPIFNIARYSDDDGEVIITHDGKEYDVDDLVEILKKYLQQEKEKLANSPIGVDK
jgi:hypothetical protein